MAVSNNRLHASKYEELILRRGRTVRWQEAIACSCINMDSGQPQYECKACFGRGYVLSDPVDDVVLVQSVTHNKEFDDMAGLFEIGDAVMTVGSQVPDVHPTTGNIVTNKRGRRNPIFDCGMYDLITLTDDVYKTSEVLIRGEELYTREPDVLLNTDVVELLRIQQANPATGEVYKYRRDIDYRLEGNKVVWIGNIELNKTSLNEDPWSLLFTENAEGTYSPGLGEQYTVQYTHRPVFTILKQLPTPRYQDGQELPKKVMIRYRAGGFDR